MHSEFLVTLEQAPSFQDSFSADRLRGFAEGFLARRWVVEQGHLTHILVPVLEGEDEVEILVNEDAGTFSYSSPGHRSRVTTRALSEIALYAFNIDAWLDDLTEIFAIEPSRRARTRTVIESHLWHLGDLRVARTHQFAPIYVARCLPQSQQDWRNALLDAIRPSQGVVLTAVETDASLPNGHQGRDLDCLLFDGPDGPTCDRDVLDRLLRGMPVDAANPDEYFDERTGELKLPHMQSSKTFIGFQNKVISILWKERHQSHVKWSEVKTRANCGKDLDTVFGKGAWTTWIENVGRGIYRLRTARPSV